MKPYLTWSLWQAAHVSNLFLGQPYLARHWLTLYGVLCTLIGTTG
jgi:hypothetical protein